MMNSILMRVTRMILVNIAFVALEVVTLVPYTTELWAGVMIDVLHVTLVSVAAGIDINASTGFDSNMWIPMVVATSESMLTMSEEAFTFGWEAFSCWSTADWNCHDLQAWIPSCHVWRTCEFPTLPQFPNQEPPRPQQLNLSDFFMIPHLEHSEFTCGTVTAGIGKPKIVKHTKTKCYEILLVFVNKQAF